MVSGGVVLILVILLGIDTSKYRALNFFATAIDALDEDKDITHIDAVRGAENKLFFSQDLYHLLTGNGIGSGITDNQGIFSFVPDDNSAFSSQELRDQRYYRLHDSWIWFGYRFGLLSYMLFMSWASVGLIRGDDLNSFYYAIILLSTLNASFSIGGLLLVAAFCVVARSRHGISLHADSEDKKITTKSVGNYISQRRLKIKMLRSI
jgi:hypothetical protein